MPDARLVDTIGNFTAIPNSIIEMGRELGPDAIALFVVLRFHSGRNQTSFPSYDTIQDRTGLTRRRIAIAIRKLESSGLLERKRRFGASTVYILKMPISPAGGLIEIEPLVQQVDCISPAGGLSLVQQVDTNKTHLTRLNKQEKDSSPTNGDASTKILSDQQRMVGALAVVTGMDVKIKTNAGRLGKRGKELLVAGYMPEQVEQLYSPGGWWYQNDWRGQKGNFPKPENIGETISIAADQMQEQTEPKIFSVDFGDGILEERSVTDGK